MELPRYEERFVQESLETFPVVLLTGARQVGKTTLARTIARGSWTAQYVTLDDPFVREAVHTDADAFLAGLKGPVVLDEVQTAPSLMRAIKVRVDQARSPGQYLLTGSANLLAMRQVEETLAGRVAIHELLPLSWSELNGRRDPPPIVDRLFGSSSAADLAALLSTVHPHDETLQNRILAGGYPTPALTNVQRTRSRWFQSYLRTYVERDIPQMAGIEHLASFERLFQMLLLRTGNLLNVADVARALGIPAATTRRYVDLLRLTYQIGTLEPYYGNHEKRMVKTPKIFGVDSGLTANLTGTPTWEDVVRDGRNGALFETWVYGELRKALAWAEIPTRMFFWRTHSGSEVDFVLERGERRVAVEVKSNLQGVRSILKNFQALAADTPLHLAVVVHAGQDVVVLNHQTLAVPATVFFSS